jgi:hypothetical protein
MLSTLDVKGTYTFCLTKFQTIPVAMHATKNWAHAACFIGAFFLRKLLVPLIILPYMSLVASEFSYSVVFGSLSQFQLEPKKKIFRMTYLSQIQKKNCQNLRKLLYRVGLARLVRFVGVDAHTCMSIYICIVFLKKRRVWQENMSILYIGNILYVANQMGCSITSLGIFSGRDLFSIV